MQNLILASHSPRRKQLLQLLNVPFDVLGSDIKEKIEPTQFPEEVVQSLAFQKASSIAKLYPHAYVIGADTVVVYQNNILGKPKDEKDAFQTLMTLSGQTHHVLTGVSIFNGNQHHTFYEQTEVTFWNLTQEEVKDYVKTGEPFDKAGSYGIQKFGSLLVKNIKGDYYNVVGLPISRLYRELKQMGFPFFNAGREGMMDKEE
ncbi:Maf family protein [Bacillus alveayuensis]|uniref:Maf family protein n=1 Tax=Aeribacillus alveayuensis TaxID=279215 RepID=UPI0005D1249E|nr:Maf family protein [Bacillus alveayuensis]